MATAAIAQAVPTSANAIGHVIPERSAGKGRCQRAAGPPGHPEEEKPSTSIMKQDASEGK